MRFLEPGNFNGLIFRDGMVFVSDIDKWITKKEYKKYEQNERTRRNRYKRGGRHERTIR